MMKQGKKPLTLEQRRQIEDKVQQEVLEFHFNQKMPDKYNPNFEIKDDIQHEEKSMSGDEMNPDEIHQLQYKLHPWHGKGKRERKAYIEDLLIQYKTGKMQKEEIEN